MSTIEAEIETSEENDTANLKENKTIEKDKNEEEEDVGKAKDDEHDDWVDILGSGQLKKKVNFYNNKNDAILITNFSGYQSWATWNKASAR